jgi:hypothetical protein
MGAMVMTSTAVATMSRVMVAVVASVGVAGVAEGQSGTNVVCWGENGYGQSTVNPALGNVTAVAAGGYHTVALKADSTVACWGDNVSGQCDVQAGLRGVTAIAAGWAHTVAVEGDGTVHCWGWNYYGQCNVPANLAPITAVAAGHLHTVALKADATVACWGGNSSGQCSVPLGVGGVTAIAAGQAHTVALKGDGTVACWGFNYYGQCAVPAGLAGVTAIAAGSIHTVAIRATGTIACWGYNGTGGCDVPEGIEAATSVAAGGYHNIVRLDTDCNSDGVRDSLRLDGYDCNGNGFPDSCDAALDILEDCNHNGLGDTCEKQLTVDLASGHIGPIGINAPAAWTIPNVVLSASPVTIRARAHGDFSGLLENVTLKLGNQPLGTAFAGTNDCGVTPWVSFTLTDYGFNDQITAKGSVTLHATATIAVDPAGCNDGTWIEFEMSYIGATSADCNANGLLDSCEITAGLAVDANGNGVIDICESAFSTCPADFDRDGFVGPSDLAQLLNAWGPAPNLPGLDLVPDGVINAADLATILGSWGTCVQ